jgi:hypothetical protein
MRLFVIWIERSLNVAVQAAHETAARQHRRAVTFRN